MEHDQLEVPEESSTPPEPVPEQQPGSVAEENVKPDEGLGNEQVPPNGNDNFPSMEQGNDQLEIHDEELEEMRVEPGEESFECKFFLAIYGQLSYMNFFQ